MTQRGPCTGLVTLALCWGCQAINDANEFVILGLSPDAGSRAPEGPPPEGPAPEGPAPEGEGPGEPPETPGGPAPEGPAPEGPPPEADCREEPNPRRCAGDVPQQCSSAGRWVAVSSSCELGCAEGVCRECEAQQICGANFRFGPCSVQPKGDSCEPGDDGNCDGVPNVPSTGACTCAAEVACGPDTEQGECARGISECVNGEPGACVGAVSPEPRDCRSALDNDCDGRPDRESCACPAGETRRCGAAPCFGQETCVLSPERTSTAWGACELFELGEFQSPEVIAGLGVSTDVWGPASSADGRTLLFGAGAPEDIFASTRSALGDVFAPATPLTAVNTLADEGTPFLSADALTLYFYSIQVGGVGDRDLWFASRYSAAADFGAPALVANVNSTAAEQNPWLTPNELRLVFDSNRPGGQGGADLWVAVRGSRAAGFGVPSNIGELNTSASEEGPALTSDGLSILFASDRPGGQGSLDLWRATRMAITGAFSAPENLVAVSSTGLDLDPSLSPDGTELLFSSGRDGVQQLYRAVRSCE